MNQYELLGVVGQGQYGVAYKARHKHDNQLYCIKRIPMTAKEDQKAALKEAQLLSSLDHPNIIAYKECFVDTDESICIVTSFCEEGDLFARIGKASKENFTFQENEVMDMFLQIASSLMYIHSKKIMHRDLKTQNIFIARGGIIVLGDFGISKILAKTADFATTVAGTPYYMAPEVCTNQPYTFKSDIWSLGCVLYEMCTLKHAFAADSLISLVYQIVRGDFPPIPSDKFSTGLSNLVNTLLLRESHKRPSLQQIFQMPFVHSHVQRFHSEEKQRLQRQAATMTRRRDAMLKTVQDAKSLSSGDNVESLTPREKKERKKQMENKKRELELQIASMNMQKDKAKVAERRSQMVHHSNIGAGAMGLVGSPQTHQPGPLLGGLYDGLGNDTSGYGGNMGDTGVNMGTMPGAHSSPSLPSSSDPSLEQTMPSAARRLSSARQSGYDNVAVGSPRQSSSRSSMHDETPVGGRSMQGAGDSVMLGSVYDERPVGGGAANTFQAGGDSVLMGSVNDAGGKSAYGGKPGAFSGTSSPSRAQTVNKSMAGASRLGTAPSSSGGPGGESVYGNTMVNMDTMPSGRFSGIFKAGGLTPPGSANGELRGSGAALPSFGGRVSSSSMQALPKGLAPVKFDPYTSFDTAQRPSSSQAAAQRYSNNNVSQYQPKSDDEYEDDFDDYEDDFEAYNPADEQEIVNQRMKILNNVEEMERSMGDSFDESSTMAMQERVGTVQRNSKVALMREKCQSALGPKFTIVYNYLKDARSAAKAPDEKEVQRKLRDIVGNDKTLVQGCFLADQLVFQEEMHR